MELIHILIEILFGLVIGGLLSIILLFFMSKND